MSEHLDLDALADALAGVSTGEQHLAGCASCASRLRELEAAEGAVRVSLAGLREPEVPAGLADRITAALAAEPPLVPAQDRPAGASAGPGSASASDLGSASGAASAASGSPAGADVTPIGAARSNRRVQPGRRTAWLAPVAAAVALLGVGGLGYAVLTGGSGSDSAATSVTAAAPAAAPALPAIPTSSSGLDYADTTAATASLPAVLRGGLAPAAGGTADTYSKATSSPAGTASTSGSAATGGGQAPVPAPSAAAEPEGRGAPPASGLSRATALSLSSLPADPLARLREPAGLESCLAALLSPDEPGTRPLALDYARYQGAPALAVLLPDPDPGKVSVFVVGPDCVFDSDDVLFFSRLTRP